MTTVAEEAEVWEPLLSARARVCVFTRWNGTYSIGSARKSGGSMEIIFWYTWKTEGVLKPPPRRMTWSSQIAVRPTDRNRPSTSHFMRFWCIFAWGGSTISWCVSRNKTVYDALCKQRNSVIDGRRLFVALFDGECRLVHIN